MNKLNLGCGIVKKKGWINTDRELDLNKFPYPFKNESADEIELCHVLEHLLYPTRVIEECYRILKPGCILRVIVPYYRSIGAYADIDHVHFFYDYSMNKFSPDMPILNYETVARFRIMKTEYLKNPSKVFRLVPMFMRNWIFNTCLQVSWEMEKA